MPIRLLVVDDNEPTRGGLQITFEAFDDIQLVGMACDGEEAVRMSRELNPDVILMDIIMPVMDGFTATRIIHREHPEIPIIGLTSLGDHENVRKELAAGAVACIFKNTTIDELANTIRGSFINAGSISGATSLRGFISG